MNFPIINYNLCDDYICYLKEYNKPKKYEQLSIDIEHNNSIISYFVTVEKDKDFKKLNFFGLPLCIQREKNKISSSKKLIKNLNKILQDKKISKIDLNLFKEISSLKYLEALDKKNISKISIQKFIELDNDINQIKNQFSESHRRKIKKEFSELNYKLIDHTNYNNEIFDMMKLHKFVSGRTTRSKESWVLNEKMILNKKGFLVSVSFDKEIISYCFFYCNNNYSEYFSSCTKRNYFKKFNNITHKSIFFAIEYLKKRKFKFFTLGESKILFNENPSSIKLENIQQFKSSFGGKKIIKILFKNINDDIINICEQV